ncbi:MAG: hypothetical protein E7071_02040 [Bacteroidales bacterium]|nr:hypothetical protein [Bacteroidales bacterium]
MKIGLNFSLILTLLLWISCDDSINIFQNEENNYLQNNSPNNKSRSILNNDTGYVYLQNPYSLDNMQEVYDIFYDGEIELEPTNLYVRFLPQDSSQLASLVYDYNLELFNYPLNIELDEGEEYVDPNIEEDEFTWLYTVVDTEFTFPSNILYEILEECYIPEEDETIATGDSRVENYVDVEEMAYTLLGYEIEETIPTLSRGKKRPEGYIYVRNNSPEMTNVDSFPVKGVKVRCRKFVKFSTTYTDTNGHYVMDSKFATSPRYSLVFDNCKGFDIWGNWGPLARASYKLGKQSKSGYSHTLEPQERAWKWAAINNAGYDYYLMCEESGITKPPTNIKILTMKNMSNSSAGMYRRIENFISFEGNTMQRFLTVLFGNQLNLLYQSLRMLMPDITIGTNGKTYSKIYRDVNHELAHTSHFSKVGSPYWADYITYIASYGTYGDGNGNNAELCAIGEMWGYAVGEICRCEKLYNDTINGEYNGLHKDDWFKPHIFWDLYRYKILSLKNIHDCMNTNVRTYNQLITELCHRYPNKEMRIKSVFMTHGLLQNNLPGTDGNIVYDSFLFNQSYSSSYTHTGNDVYGAFLFVYPGGNLTIDASNSVTIDYPFIVESGASFTIQRTD